MVPASLGGVAQLVRALACHARGRGFESRHSRHEAFSFAIARRIPKNKFLRIITRMNTGIKDPRR